MNMKAKIAEQRRKALSMCHVITQEELKARLAAAAANNRCIVSISLVAEKTGVKKSCPINVAAKVSTITGIIQRKAGMYERAVDKQRGQEGLEEPFEAGRPNYEWIGDGPFALQSGRLCLPMKAQGGGSVFYGEDGDVLDADSLKPHMLAKSPPKNQGTEEPVQWRAPYADNIIEARIDGESFVVLQSDDAQAQPVPAIPEPAQA